MNDMTMILLAIGVAIASFAGGFLIGHLIFLWWIS